MYILKATKEKLIQYSARLKGTFLGNIKRRIFNETRLLFKAVFIYFNASNFIEFIKRFILGANQIVSN